MTATDELREYKCEYYRLRAHPKSCFFCDVDSDIDRGLQGVCQKFYEVDE